VIREPLPIEDSRIATSLEQEYGILAANLTFLPIGYDPNAAVYRVGTSDGADLFLKLSRNPPAPSSLAIPRALLDMGIANLLGPIPTQQGALSTQVAAYHMMLYPFIEGENAMNKGMNATQWRSFGATLQAIHGSGLAAQFANELPHENFATPMVGKVRVLLEQALADDFALPVQQELVGFLRQHTELVASLLLRTAQLGASLQQQPFEYVLCHGDIHAANIMLSNDDKLYLVDWDTPRIAPRERDLLFIVGSIIARRVTAAEEAFFFAGYGPWPVDRNALQYYRCERALEDIYECSNSVLFNQAASLAVKAGDLRMLKGLFAPGDIVELALSPR
jgi:spectinomycin phosphotransferase